jgi:hypothetical protein
MRLSFFSVSEAFYFISHCSHHSLNSQKQNGSVNYPCYHRMCKEGWWLSAGSLTGSDTSLRWEILTASFLFIGGWLNIVWKLFPFLCPAISNHSTRCSHL